jgi:germination protein M
MKHLHFFKHLVWIGVCLWATIACSLMGSKDQQDIDPPQVTSETIPSSISNEHEPTDQQQTRMQTIYVKDHKGFVAPLSFSMPKSPSPARTALQSMVVEGPMAHLIPEGFQAILPKGTEIKGISISPTTKQATVDFTAAFSHYDAADERKILEAVTWTLTSFPTIDSVQIRVEGKHLHEMPVAKTPIDEPWSRKMGINLEKADAVTYGQATPVTLYFMNQTSQHYKYYVPVTRMIKRTDQLAQAVIQQLVTGPHVASGLHTAINPTAELKDMTTSTNLVTLDFNENLLGPDQKVSAEALHMIVLSLTENIGVNHIQFKVNGSKEVYSHNLESYDKPVSRPKHVNITEL